MPISGPKLVVLKLVVGVLGLALVIAPARSKVTYAVGRFVPGVARRMTARFVGQQMEAMR